MKSILILFLGLLTLIFNLSAQAAVGFEGEEGVTSEKISCQVLARETPDAKDFSKLLLETPVLLGDLLVIQDKNTVVLKKLEKISEEDLKTLDKKETIALSVQDNMLTLVTAVWDISTEDKLVGRSAFVTLKNVPLIYVSIPNDLLFYCSVKSIFQ